MLIRRPSKRQVVANLLKGVVPEAVISEKPMSPLATATSVWQLLAKSGMHDLGIHGKLGLAVAVNRTVSLDQLISLGNFNSVHPKISCFECDTSGFCEEILFPICFLRKMSIAEVDEAFSLMGLRPADLIELLSFEYKTQGNLNFSMLTALASRHYFTDEFFAVPQITKSRNGSKELSIALGNLVFRANTWFLATRKE